MSLSGPGGEWGGRGAGRGSVMCGAAIDPAQQLTGPVWGVERMLSRDPHCPSGRGGAQAEHGQARQVVRGGEEVEVGVDLAML